MSRAWLACPQTLRMVGLYRISEASVFQFIHSAPQLQYLDITQCDKRAPCLPLSNDPVVIVALMTVLGCFVWLLPVCSEPGLY